VARLEGEKPAGSRYYDGWYDGGEASTSPRIVLSADTTASLSSSSTEEDDAA